MGRPQCADFGIGHVEDPSPPNVANEPRAAATTGRHRDYGVTGRRLQSLVSRFLYVAMANQR